MRPMFEQWFEGARKGGQEAHHHALTGILDGMDRRHGHTIISLLHCGMRVRQGVLEIRGTKQLVFCK